MINSLRPALPQSQLIDQHGSVVCTGGNPDINGLTKYEVALIAAMQGLLAGDPNISTATMKQQAELHAEALMDLFNV